MNAHCTKIIVSCCFLLSCVFGNFKSSIDTAFALQTEHQLPFKPFEQQIPSKLVDVDKGVAIDGAWQRVEIAIQDFVANEPVYASYRIPEINSQRFLGFLEGLLGVSLPASFSNNILHAVVFHGNLLRFPLDRFSPWEQEERPFADMTMRKMPTTSVDVDRNKVIVSTMAGVFPSVGEQGKIMLPQSLSDSLLERLEKGDTPINSALFTGKRVFLFVTDDSKPGGVVYCLSSVYEDDGAIQWSKKARNYDEMYRGVDSWFTEMRLSKDELILFHLSESAFSIEGFSFDGEQTFSFGTRREDKQGIAPK